MEPAAIALIAVLVQTDWFCSSGLETDRDYALRIGFRLAENGTFQGYGLPHPLEAAQRFDWEGSWTLHDGQLAMIGTTHGHGAPSGELRAIATVTQRDVILIEAAGDTGPARMMRCLTYKLE